MYAMKKALILKKDLKFAICTPILFASAAVIVVAAGTE
jgi:hypothetical protein